MFWERRQLAESSKTATGNITEDLQAIRELIRPGTYGFDVYVIENRFPWSPPASEEAIERLRTRVPEVPDEVIEIFGVTENLIAGFLNFRDGLDGVHQYSRAYTISEIGTPTSFSNETREFAEDDDGWVPDGDFLRVAQDLRVATGGPHTGVIYTGASEGWQRSAYRFSDVVACTRELYENGWFELIDFTGRLEKSEGFEAVYSELVLPTIQRWHCSPRIATLMRYSEPSRPLDL